MTAPKRWLESEHTSAEALELLRAGRAPLRLDEAARGRSRRRVAALAALPVAAGVLVSLPQIALGAVVGALGTVALLSAADVWVRSKAEPAPSSSASIVAPFAPSRAHPPASPLPTQVLTTSPTSETPPAPAGPEASAPARRTLSDSPATSNAPEAAQNELEQEIALLEKARRKLALEPHGALSMLREHERLFPSGQLRIEREFLSIDALVRLGRRGEAESRAKALELQAPQSLYGERLNRILGAKHLGERR